MSELAPDKSETPKFFFFFQVTNGTTCSECFCFFVQLLETFFFVIYVRLYLELFREMRFLDRYQLRITTK